ncbi:MAG: helix-turn-helix transcriptional regulator [Bacilli bacterium]|nr:helix-turn-helix transcriptional regulator [Bacilli bacterium]
MYKRIKDLREDHDLTQTEVAKVLSISQRGYSHIETGNNDISSDALIKLAKFYEVNTDYILGISDISEPYQKIQKENNSK